MTITSSIKWIGFRSCCFHHALHGRSQITVWDCLQSSCQYLCTSRASPHPSNRSSHVAGSYWRHVLRDRLLTKTRGSLLISNNGEIISETEEAKASNWLFQHEVELLNLTQILKVSPRFSKERQLLRCLPDHLTSLSATTSLPKNERMSRPRNWRKSGRIEIKVGRQSK